MNEPSERELARRIVRYRAGALAPGGLGLAGAGPHYPVSAPPGNPANPRAPAGSPRYPTVQRRYSELLNTAPVVITFDDENALRVLERELKDWSAPSTDPQGHEAGERARRNWLRHWASTFERPAEDASTVADAQVRKFVEDGVRRLGAFGISEDLARRSILAGIRDMERDGRFGGLHLLVMKHLQTPAELTFLMYAGAAVVGVYVLVCVAMMLTALFQSDPAYRTARELYPLAPPIERKLPKLPVPTDLFGKSRHTDDAVIQVLTDLTKGGDWVSLLRMADLGNVEHVTKAMLAELLERPEIPTDVRGTMTEVMTTLAADAPAARSGGRDGLAVLVLKHADHALKELLSKAGGTQ